MEQNCFNKIKSHYLKRIKAWPFRSVKYDYEKKATFKKEGKVKVNWKNEIHERDNEYFIK